MSDNNKANNKIVGFFKNLSGFKKFLMIYASVLVVIIAVALVLLHGLLKDYETGRPANTMDNFVSHIQQGDVGDWIDKEGLLSSFETKDKVSEYFKNTFEGKNISYKKKAGEYTENTPVYVIYADEEKIANVSLTEKKKNAHNFTEWKLADIDFNVNSKDNNHTVKISVPNGSEVSVNGVKVSQDYLAEQTQVDLCKHTTDYVATPLNDIYNINGLFAQPEVTVSYNGVQLDTQLNNGVYAANYPTDENLLASEREHILTIAREYGKYMINRGDLNLLSSYMIGNAKEYMSDIPAIDVYLIGRTFTYDISDENISNFRKYSDDCYSCDIDYNLNVKWSSGSTVYNISLTYVFVNTQNGWMLADFAIR